MNSQQNVPVFLPTVGFLCLVLVVGSCFVGGVAAASAVGSATASNESEGLTVGDATVFVSPDEAELDDVASHLDAAVERDVVTYGDVFVVAFDVGGLPANATFEEVPASITLEDEGTPEVPGWELEVHDGIDGVEVVPDGAEDAVYLVVSPDEFAPDDEPDYYDPWDGWSSDLETTLSVPANATAENESQETAVDFALEERAVEDLSPTQRGRDGLVLERGETEISGTTTLAPGNELSVIVHDGDRQRSTDVVVDADGEWAADLDIDGVGDEYAVSFEHEGEVVDAPFAWKYSLSVPEAIPLGVFDTLPVEIDELDVPNSVGLDEEFDGSARFHNPNEDESVTVDATLRLSGERVAESPVTIAPGASERVEFGIDASAFGHARHRLELGVEEQSVGVESWVSIVPQSGSDGYPPNHPGYEGSTSNESDGTTSDAGTTTVSESESDAAWLESPGDTNGGLDADDGEPDAANESDESANESEEPTGGASGSADGATADDLPGFSLVGAVLATLAVVAIGARRRP